jgi:DNA ligase (NAD+)
LSHFVSQGAMDIRGLGEKQVSALQRQGLVTTAADFYDLTPEVLSERLVEAIDASRARPFARVLYAIGLEEVGFVTGRALARHFRTIDALLDATPERIAQTPGIGPIVAARIHEQLAQPAMRELIARLRAAGLRFQEEGPAPGEGPLSGKAIVLTGTLPDLTREEATERIVAAGGRVTSSVSGKTAFVVAGEAPGTKLEKAQRLGVPVVDEAGLLEALRG